MDSSNLIYYIRNGREERNIEYKGNVSWNDNNIKFKLIKTILAMSNIPDGGTIVIGVDENKDTHKFNLVGLNESNLKSFSQDDIQQKVNEFADPYVELRVSYVEHEEKKFVIIRVTEFDELPTICKRDGMGNLCKGDIYTRAKQKHETKKIPSQVEMREIIERAVIKSRVKFFTKISEMELNINKRSDAELFDEQLGGL